MERAECRPYLSVIVPAFNEEKRITTTLHAIETYLKKQSYTWELLVVLDGSTDGTLSRVKQFARGRDNFRWMDRPDNRGKGYTVREGMLAARGQYRLFTDADNSTDITHFDQMLPLLHEGYDIVICSRDPKDAAGARQAVPQPFIKRLLGNLGNLFIQIVAVPGIWDTQCGFKVFSRQASMQIFSVSRIERWGFDVEALALARRSQYSIAIVPAYWIDDPRTNVRSVRDYIESATETLQIRWNLVTGTYDRQIDAPVRIAKLADD